MLNNQRRMNSCPQNHNSTALKDKLKAIDFALYDTILFLDAYPDCSKALSHYHKLLSERTRIAEALALSGSPVTNRDNKSTDTWYWTDGPWPWESNAN